ncbi:YceI-like domain-containing protein [Massilia sp. CF038]|nr:YceI-like domain-containing protein [Massilia sp. CF038]
MKPILSILMTLLLASCALQAPPPVPPPAASPSAPDAPAWYQQAARDGVLVCAIDSAKSLITVLVRRGGPMARFGHDHVVASRSVEGFAAPAAGRADVQFRLDALSVDEPGLRQEAGLDTQPDADAIAGTRTNMLTRVLDAETYPLVQLHAERSTADSQKVNLTITLHGVTKTLAVPVIVESNTASGAFTLLQSDFGITPMSVMGGAIKVQDELALQFRLVACAP